jgi:hypothetical protein
MNDFESTFSAYNRHREARASLSAGNKNAVFDALGAANITQVLVEFDGMGDSGQIENVTAHRGDELVELPSTTVTIQQIAWGSSEPVTTEQTLKEAVETLCYDYLEETHDGWENNDGAYGEFLLDVAERTVDLEFQERNTATLTENHTF